MKNIFTKEVKIGICVVIALLILFFGIDFLKGINVFKAANYYYASYTNVEGLAVSAPVNVNGFKVGLVRSIEYEYDNPGHVLVEMSLDRALKLPEGTVAVLGSDLLGTASIQLQLADNTNYYKVGATIKGENASGLMDAVSKDLMPSISVIFPKVDTLLTNINKLVANPALQTSISRLDAITADLERTTKNLSAMTAQMGPIATDVKQITGNVSGMTADLLQVSGELKDIPVDSLAGTLQSTIDNLHALTEQLKDPNSSLGLLMNDPALYNNINSTVQSLDSLFVDIKRNPKRYISIKVF